MTPVISQQLKSDRGRWKMAGRVTFQHWKMTGGSFFNGVNFQLYTGLAKIFSDSIGFCVCCFGIIQVSYLIFYYILFWLRVTANGAYRQFNLISTKFTVSVLAKTLCCISTTWWMSLPFGFSLFFFFCAFGTSLFNFWNYLFWPRITDEGSIPEMCIWSIS